MNKRSLKTSVLNAKNVLPFYFSTSLSKNTIDECITILMTEVGVHVFGYNRQNDEYWGRLKINKKDNIYFTMVIKHILENTIVSISIFNTNCVENDKISFKFCETLKLFENSQSIYKKKYNF